MKRLLALGAVCLALCPARLAAAPVEQSVVTIRAMPNPSDPNTYEKQGTGFHVGGGLIVTAFHVVQSARKIEIAPAQGEITTDVKVRAIDAMHDLAVLSAQKLSTLPALYVYDRIPSEQEELRMIGSAAGLPGSVYLVHSVHHSLVEITQFSDLSGNSLFPNAAPVQVLQIQGIIYGGISGGPIVSSNGAVLAVADGSLAEGGAFGWAIPSREIERLLRSPPTLAGIENYRWPEFPFAPDRFRAMEYRVRKNSARANLLSNFTKTRNRLGSLTEQIQSLSLRIDNGLSVCDVSLRPAPGISESEFTPDMVTDELSEWRPDFRRMADLLSQRYGAEHDLRLAAGSLNELVNRATLAPDVAKRVQSSISQIDLSHQAVATDSYEDSKGINQEKTLADLRSIANGPWEIKTMDDVNNARSRCSDLKATVSEYMYNFEFQQWSSAELAYFDDVGAVLQNLYPLVVYVPA